MTRGCSSSSIPWLGKLVLFVALLLIQSFDLAFSFLLTSPTTTSTTFTTAGKTNTNNSKRLFSFPSSAIMLRREKTPPAAATAAAKDDNDNDNDDVTMKLRAGASAAAAPKQKNDDVENENENELKDYSAQASGLFGNLRVPAALFAGASAGAAFAMPLMSATDTFQLGLTKRIYALLMMSALSCEILTVLLSTVTMGMLSSSASSGGVSSPATNKKTKNVSVLLSQQYAFEWVTARLHFLAGVIFFVLGAGIRAWVSIACPVVSTAALGIVGSATLLGLAVIQSAETAETSSKDNDDDAFVVGLGLLKLPYKFVTLLWRKAVHERRFLFVAAMLSYFFTWTYIAVKAPHVYNWLAAAASAAAK